MSNIFAKRRKMPEIVFDQNISKCTAPYILIVSCDVNYLKKYAIPLLKSLVIHSPQTSLLINCVDIDLQSANSYILDQCNYIPNNLYLSKSSLNGFAENKEIRSAYLKTLRFHVANIVQNTFNKAVIISDIDSLITNNSFDQNISSLLLTKVDACFGSTSKLEDLICPSFQNNYLWRSIKAGFTFFSNSLHGKQMLERVTQSLFNFKDPIPPIENLKLYRAYYGDQLALIFTFFEAYYGTSNIKIKCLGANNNDFISFDKITKSTSFWIPPASKRIEKFIDKYRNYRLPNT